MTLHFTIAPKLATQISKFQFYMLNLTICIPIDRAHQAEQILWRHLMIIYYGMRGMEVWMDQTHENDKNVQKFITFRKSNEFEKFLRNIVVGG